MAKALSIILDFKSHSFFRPNFVFLISSVRHVSQDKFTIPEYFFFNSSFDNEREKFELMKSIFIHQDFLSENEEESLLIELEPYLKRMRYESGHWDNAIKGYRETERVNWNSTNSLIIDKIKKIAFKLQDVPLKHVHILDLEENGVIMPHIDSIKFCGSTIAGVSLLSDSVMRLIQENNKNYILDILLKRRSLYIMTGLARYNYTHEILGNENSKFGSKEVRKSRRISVICRNEP